MEVVQKNNIDDCRKPLPLFEIGVVLFMGFGGVSFLLVDADFLDEALLTGLFIKVFPLYIWGVIQLITCVSLGLGLVLSKDWARKIGLGLAFLVFFAYAITYFSGAKLVGGVYGINSFVSLMSLLYVHQTEL